MCANAHVSKVFELSWASSGPAEGAVWLSETHGRSESQRPQVTHTVSPPVTLIDSHVSEVIYFFKTTYCVTLFLLILLFTY